jgi:hypothetical protein
LFLFIAHTVIYIYSKCIRWEIQQKHRILAALKRQCFNSSFSSCCT